MLQQQPQQQQGTMLQQQPQQQQQGTMLQQQQQQQIELTTAGSNTLQVPCDFEAWHYEFEYFLEHPEDELDEGAESRQQQASPRHPQLLTWQPCALFQEKPQQQPDICSRPIGSEATTATYGYVFSSMCDAGVAPNAHVNEALVPVAQDVNQIVSDDSAGGGGGAAVVAAAGAKRHYVTPAASPKKKARTTTTGLNRIWDDPDRPKRSRSAYN